MTEDISKRDAYARETAGIVISSEPGRVILEHEPHLVAIDVAVDLRVRADTGLEARDPIPRRAEQAVAHARALKASQITPIAR